MYTPRSTSGTRTCVIHHAAGRRRDVAGAVVETTSAAPRHQAGQASGSRRRREMAHAAHSGWRGTTGRRRPTKTRIRVAVAVRETVLVGARTCEQNTTFCF